MKGRWTCDSTAAGAGARRSCCSAVDPDRCPWPATGAALQRAGPSDDDHAGRRAAWCGADVVRRHAADDPAVATILTTAHDIHRITVAFSAGRISIAHATAAAARAGPRRLLRHNALMTAAHSAPTSPVPILGSSPPMSTTRARSRCRRTGQR